MATLNLPTQGAITLLPTLIAIALAIYTRRIALSLGFGVLFGWVMLTDWSVIRGGQGALFATMHTAIQPSNASVLLFTLTIGALIAVIQNNGGIQGFIHWIEQRQWVKTRRSVQMFAWCLGAVIFIESNITILVTGTVARPLFDYYRVSREKLAYLIDTTAAPICILIPLNAWGAYILGLLTIEHISNPLHVFVKTFLFNFYPILAVILAGITALINLNIGSMRAAERRAQENTHHYERVSQLASSQSAFQASTAHPKALNMILPIAIMMSVTLLSMGLIGGTFTKTSGAISVFWGVLAGLLTSWGLSLCQGILSFPQLVQISARGVRKLLGMALVLLLAMVLSDVTNQLGTGPYLAHLVGDHLPQFLVLPLLFLVACLMAFATGSSWGTFGITIPLAVPLAYSLQLPIPPFVGAALSGGIFGDHCSPISDTTIIASFTAGTDHIDHVRTQMPYALIGLVIATIAFLMVGVYGALG